MALQALAATLHAQGALSDDGLAAVQRELGPLFEATEDDEQFRPGSLRPALERIRASLR
jgi:hypothetical protein